jgi:hypothetical protein
MIDTVKNERLMVSTDGGVGPYIDLPYSQVEDVKRILDSHKIHYWVHENVLSWNGGPYMAVIDFGRYGDAATIQAALDSVQ